MTKYLVKNRTGDIIRIEAPGVPGVDFELSVLSPESRNLFTRSHQRMLAEKRTAEKNSPLGLDENQDERALEWARPVLAKCLKRAIGFSQLADDLEGEDLIKEICQEDSHAAYSLAMAALVAHQLTSKEVLS